MKNLDLNSYGVQEMDAKAMEEANGGSLILLALFIAGLIYCACDNDPETVSTVNGQRVGN